MNKPKLTQERANLITGFLNADESRATQLLQLEPSEAVKKINALGYDFTEAEIIEYGKALDKAIKVDDDALESVAGGVGGDDFSEDVAPAVVVVVVAAPKVKTGAVIATAAISSAVSATVGGAIGWVAGRLS